MVWFPAQDETMRRMRHRDMRVNITLLLFFIFFSFVLSNT